MKNFKALSVWKKLLALSLVLMLVTSLLIIGMDTSWGTVSVKTGTTLSAQGTKLGYKIYVPKTATAETPAPCVVWGCGGGSLKDMGYMFATELSRRGFVVVNFDAVSNGASEQNPGTDGGNGMTEIFEMASSLDFVDSSRMITGGQSMGGWYSMNVAQQHQDQVLAEISLGMNFWGDAELGYDFNYAYIVGEKDESALVRTTNHNTLDDMIQSAGLKVIYGYSEDQTIQVGEVVGDFRAGTGRLVLTPNVMHFWEEFNPKAVVDVMSVVAMTLDMPNPIDVHSTHVLAYNLLMWIMMISFGLFAVSLAVSLLETKAFASLTLKPTKYAGIKHNTFGWYAAFGCLTVITGWYIILAYEHNDKYALLMKLGDDSGARLLWALVTAALLIVYLVVYHFVYGKKNHVSARDYGLATSNDDGFHASYIGKAAVFAVVYVALFYGAYYLYHSLTQCTIHVMNFNISPIVRNRALTGYPWLIIVCMLPYMFATSMAQRTVVGFDGSDTPRKTAAALGTSTLICVLTFLVIQIVFVIAAYCFHTTLFYNARGYCGADSMTAAIVGTLIFNSVGFFVNRKAGNNWIGLVVGLLLNVWFLLLGTGMAA